LLESSNIIIRNYNVRAKKVTLIVEAIHYALLLKGYKWACPQAHPEQISTKHNICLSMSLSNEFRKHAIKTKWDDRCKGKMRNITPKCVSFMTKIFSSYIII